MKPDNSWKNIIKKIIKNVKKGFEAKKRLV